MCSADVWLGFKDRSPAPRRVATFLWRSQCGCGFRPLPWTPQEGDCAAARENIAPSGSGNPDHVIVSFDLQTILLSPKFHCTEEILTIVSLLSVDSVLYNPPAQRDEVQAVRRKFLSSEGDHVTLLNIYRTFKSLGGNKVSLSPASSRTGRPVLGCLLDCPESRGGPVHLGRACAGAAGQGEVWVHPLPGQVYSPSTAPLRDTFGASASVFCVLSVCF